MKYLDLIEDEYVDLLQDAYSQLPVPSIRIKYYDNGTYRIAARKNAQKNKQNIMFLQMLCGISSVGTLDSYAENLSGYTPVEFISEMINEDDLENRSSILGENYADFSISDFKTKINDIYMDYSDATSVEYEIADVLLNKKELEATNIINRFTYTDASGNTTTFDFTTNKLKQKTSEFDFNNDGEVTMDELVYFANISAIFPENIYSTSIDKVKNATSGELSNIVAVVDHILGVEKMDEDTISNYKIRGTGDFESDELTAYLSYYFFKDVIENVNTLIVVDDSGSTTTKTVTSETVYYSTSGTSNNNVTPSSSLIKSSTPSGTTTLTKSIIDPSDTQPASSTTVVTSASTVSGTTSAATPDDYWGQTSNTNNSELPVNTQIINGDDSTAPTVLNEVTIIANKTFNTTDYSNLYYDLSVSALLEGLSGAINGIRTGSTSTVVNDLTTLNNNLSSGKHVVFCSNGEGEDSLTSEIFEGTIDWNEFDDVVDKDYLNEITHLDVIIYGYEDINGLTSYYGCYAHNTLGSTYDPTDVWSSRAIDAANNIVQTLAFYHNIGDVRRYFVAQGPVFMKNRQIKKFGKMYSKQGVCSGNGFDMARSAWSSISKNYESYYSDINFNVIGANYNTIYK